MKNQIKEFRNQKGISQISLAKSAQVTQGMVSAYENGRIPTLMVAFRIAKVLGVTVEKLFNGSGGNHAKGRKRNTKK